MSDAEDEQDDGPGNSKLASSSRMIGYGGNPEEARKALELESLKKEKKTVMMPSSTAAAA